MNTLETRTLSLEGAKKIVEAAEVTARQNGWNVAIAVVDLAGHLVHFSKLDGTQAASAQIAIGKARTAATFKRPTKVLEDAINGGRYVMLAVEGIVPMEGGIPVVIDGQILGGVGVSGVTSAQDAVVAQAGADAVK